MNFTPVTRLLIWAEFVAEQRLNQAVDRNHRTIDFHQGKPSELADGPGEQDWVRKYVTQSATGGLCPASEHITRNRVRGEEGAAAEEFQRLRLLLPESGH